jgi:hypothetical protein
MVKDLLRDLSEPAFYGRMWSEVSPRVAFDAPPALVGDRDIARATLPCAPADIAAMRDAVVAVTGAGLPGVFAFAYDAFWQLANALREVAAAFAEVPSTELALVPDVWAFHVPPGRAHRGWPMHRGIETSNRDARGRLRLVNTWVALSPATRASSCMYFVPLGRDPHAPGALHELPDAGLGEARELAPGGALVWDANVAHWGGPSSDDAREARISVSYTFSTDEAAEAVDVRTLTFERRLAIVARQIVTYGARDPAVTPALDEWARVWLAIREAATRGPTPA